jgi:hypothetical protein
MPEKDSGEGEHMTKYPGFQGDEHDFWDASIDNSDECLPQREIFTERDNAVIQEQISRRVKRLGYFMIRILGDLANSGKTLHDLYPRLVEGPGVSYTGWMLTEYKEFWSALCYLTAPEDKRYHYWEESAFFLQLSGVYTLLAEAHQSLLEEAPMCMGAIVDEVTGQTDYPVTLIDENGEEYREVFRSQDEWHKFFVMDRIDAEYDRIVAYKESRQKESAGEQE